MKITQGVVKPAFEPITIILETLEEAEVFKFLSNVASGVAGAVLKETQSYDITETRRQAIVTVLQQIWSTKAFQDLPVVKQFLGYLPAVTHA
jgi:hypothetical protein